MKCLDPVQVLALREPREALVTLAQTELQVAPEMMVSLVPPDLTE